MKETEKRELKKSTSELKEALVSIVAMLNKHQKGEIYFGVKNNGEVIGQKITEQTIRGISQAIATKIDPIIYPTVEEVMLDRSQWKSELGDEAVPVFIEENDCFGRALAINPEQI